MESLSKELHAWLAGDGLVKAIRASVVVVLALPLARVLGAVVARAMSRMLVPAQTALARRIVSYGIVALGFVMALRELGFDLTALLGAAGILTVAIGFASQTVASNLISGLFLIGERGIEIGSVVKIGNTLGEILSIDTLSVKLRTFDNLLVRLPNETLIKSEIQVYTEFPIRRIDIAMGAAYGDDLDAVEEALRACATDNPLCLEEPAPLFLVLGYGDNSVSLQFSVWAQREKFLDARTGILRDIKRGFDERGLTFPFPQRDVHLYRADGKADAAERPAA